MSIKNHRVYFYIPIIICVFFGIGMLAGHFLPNDKAFLINNKYSPVNNKLDAVLEYIQEEYVDSISKNDLVELSIPALLQNLDPHSVYIPASEFNEVNEPLEGEFEGIGVEFNIQNDTIIVVNTVSGGPSERRGIMAGDRIVKINDTLVAGVKIKNADVMKKLKGKKDSHVKLSIKRSYIKNLLSFDITRDKIPLVSIDASFMVKKDIGYIKVSKFARTTAQEFRNAISALKQQGMKKVVVDLRGNGGGYLDAATQLADEFLTEGKLIVYTKGRSRTQTNTYATSDGFCQDEEIIVLIDEWSASASEIFAGAIQDNDRGTIIGRRSFGKGLVQEPVFFHDGSSLRLTIARYYTPTGRCIQRPYNKGETSYYEEIADRYYNGEMEIQDSIKQNDSLKFKTPGGKIVYGGGGIMPDVFVPYDTSGITKYFSEAVSRALIYKFAFDYTDNNRKMLNSFHTWQELEKYLDKINLLSIFTDYSIKNGLTPNNQDIEKSKSLIKTHLKAYIIRNVFDDKGFYPVALQVDNVYQAAIKYFEKNK
jgi:carboxyl-terminal processing protease